MKRKTKDMTTYMIVNLVLLIIAALFTLYIVVKYKDNKDSIINTIYENANIIESSIQVEKEENKENTTSSIILPIISESSGSSDVSGIYYQYFYNQLDGNAKSIYNSIEKNANNMKSGTYNVSLESSIGNSISSTGNTDLLNKEFQSAWDSIIMDKVDLFYIDVSKVNLKIKTITYSNNVVYSLDISSNDNGNYLDQSFKDKQIVDIALQQVNSISDQIVKKLNGSDYEKVLKAHDWLVDNVDYDSKADNNVYNIYGAFVNKKAVCEGYAEAFKYLMDKSGIKCILVTGTAQNSEGNIENHEWDEVQINGKWYAVDVTWDDPILKNGAKLTNSLKHKYLLKGSNLIKENHFEDGKLSTNGVTFTYPTLENEDY